MGRFTQGHYDDIFFNKIKQACLHVLDQLNEANEINQAFDLCPSISRRNRVILSFLRDADHVRTNDAASASTSPPLPNRHPTGSMRASREPSLGTDSVASLSAQRRRRAREMQYVRDPNDSNDDSDSQATIGPSSFSRTHLDSAPERTPSMSQPDYTFEQFAQDLDPNDKLLKRSLEIIIKETARQALARKRDPTFDAATASASSSSRDPAASLRSAIASSHADRTPAHPRSRDDAAFARRMSRVLNADSASTSRAANLSSADLNHAYRHLGTLRPPPRSSDTSSLTYPSGDATWISTTVLDFSTGTSSTTTQELPARSSSSVSSLPSTSDHPLSIRTRRSDTGRDADQDVSLTRTTSLSRRNAVRAPPLTNTDASILRSARSSLSLRRPDASSAPTVNLQEGHSAGQDDTDAVEQVVVETSIESVAAQHAGDTSQQQPEEMFGDDSALLAASERPRAGRSGSFTFTTTPAAVLRSRQRSESRSQGDQRTASPATFEEAPDARDSEAEEYIDLDLDLGMAGEGTFDFDLVDFLRSESRRRARDSGREEVESNFAGASPLHLRRRRRARDEDEESEPSDAASPSGIRVYVSGSGASTPAEARQATFEAYAQRARLLERRRRMERQRQDDEREAAADGTARPVGGANGSEETSPQNRRRRRGRGIGVETGSEVEGGQDRRNSLPFPSRTSQR